MALMGASVRSWTLSLVNKVFKRAFTVSSLHVSRLTDDCLRPAGKFARLFIGRSMEAPAVFKRVGKYYFIGSGCTAWDPNAARSAVAENIFGPWTELGNPCLGPDATNTFHAQSTYVLPVAGRAATFIFMADRWKQWNLPDSRYLWLPLEFSAAGNPVVRWQERWSLNSPSTPSQASVAGTNTVSARLQ